VSTSPWTGGPRALSRAAWCDRCTRPGQIALTSDTIPTQPGAVALLKVGRGESAERSSLNASEALAGNGRRHRGHLAGSGANPADNGHIDAALSELLNR
jgi:hypothetical protein